jgi:hypothetical protein
MWPWGKLAEAVLERSGPRNLLGLDTRVGTLEHDHERIPSPKENR